MPLIHNITALFIAFSASLWGNSLGIEPIAATAASFGYPKIDIVQASLKQSDAVPVVPFYSQFHDVSDPSWQKLACGIADLAMLVEFYKPGSVSVDSLLAEGISAGAYIEGAGWSHAGLARLAETHGLTGTPRDFSDVHIDEAFLKFKEIVNEGPVIASVYYRFEYGNPIPHLAVINGVDGDTVYYNDPARGVGGETISVADFKKAWKKRFITVRPM